MTAARPIPSDRATPAKGKSSGDSGQSNTNHVVEGAKIAGQTVQWGLAAYGGYRLYKDIRKEVFPSQETDTDTTQPPTEWLAQNSHELVEEALGKNRQSEIEFKDPEQAFSRDELYQYFLCYQREKRAIGKSWKKNKVRNEMISRVVCYDEIMRKKKAKGSPPQGQPDENPASEPQQQGHRGVNIEDYFGFSAGDIRHTNPMTRSDLLHNTRAAIEHLGRVIGSDGLRAVPSTSKGTRTGIGPFSIPNVRLPVFAG